MSLLAALSLVPPLTGAQLATLDPEASRARENLLRAELQRLREERPGSGVCADAYNRLSHECAAMGRPLGALYQFSPDEAERFFARTVQGPDGHVYWMGGKRFYRNDRRKSAIPRRWWWEHGQGRPLSLYDEFANICGDTACINPEHHTVARRTRQWYTERQILGAIQVAAMRLGKSPTIDQWEQGSYQPDRKTILQRFGSWPNALRAAGLQPNKVGGAGRNTKTPEGCIAALRLVHDLNGRWPTWTDFDKARAELRAAKLPSSRCTIRRHLGHWPQAIERAKGGADG